MRLSKFLLAALALSIPLATSVAATEVDEAALAYRQALFKSIVWNFSPMSEMVRGKREFDAAEAKKRALTVSYLSLLLAEAFPKGSGSNAGTTDALDAIWQQPEDFAARLKTFQFEANELRKVAEQGQQESFTAQFRKLGAACKGCHDSYKAD
jgi:cytochrome c556